MNPYRHSHCLHSLYHNYLESVCLHRWDTGLQFQVKGFHLARNSLIHLWNTTISAPPWGDFTQERVRSPHVSKVMGQPDKGGWRLRKYTLVLWTGLPFCRGCSMKDKKCKSFLPPQASLSIRVAGLPENTMAHHYWLEPTLLPFPLPSPFSLRF